MPAQTGWVPTQGAERAEHNRKARLDLRVSLPTRLRYSQAEEKAIHESSSLRRFAPSVGFSP